MHKNIILFTLILFFNTTSIFSQNTRHIIDSLFTELEKVDEKKKIDILNNLSTNYWNYSLDSSLYFANEALNLAHILQDKKGIADSYNRIGNVYSFQNESELALEFYQKCLNLRIEINDSQGITNIYHNIAYEYIAQSDYNKAITFFTKALEESKRREDKEDVADYYMRIAESHSSLSNNKEAIKNYLTSIEIAKEINNVLMLAGAYNGLGNVYVEISSYDESLKYFLDALDIYKEQNEPIGISMIYNNLGIVYQSLNENDQALSYYQKSLQIDIEYDLKDGQANTLNNIGTCYDDNGDKEKALEYYNKALQMNKELGITDGISTALNNIGLIYLDSGDYEKSHQNLTEAAKISKEINDIYSLANIHNNLGKLFLHQKKYQQAKTNLDLAIKLAKQTNTIEWLIESYELYSQLYSELNDYKKSLEYFKLFSAVNDSVSSSKNSNRITELKIKYETDNLETENELLKKNNQINVLELDRQKNIKNYWIAFSILFLILTLLVFSRFRLKKKTNNLLESKNNQLSDANKKLTISEHNLKELNATKDKFFSIIAHDLKNPFQSLLGFSETLYNQVDTLEKQNIVDYSKIIYESSQKLYNLLGNLLQWSKSQLGSVKFSPRSINLYESVDDVLSIFNITSQKKNIRITNSIHKESVVFADKHVVSTVLRNLISNSIKFTSNGGIIEISSVTSNNKISITVKDSGEGIKPENMDKLFRIDLSYSTKGTENESGTGLGLILCKELITQSDGEIHVESEYGKGSSFIFTLPIPKE